MKCMKTVRKAAPWVCVLLAVLMLVPTLPVATRAADSGLDVSYMKTVHTETFDGKKLPALQAGNPAPRADGLYPLNSLYESGSPARIHIYLSIYLPISHLIYRQERAGQ